ncbi:MAG: hypothetical protein KF753_18330 [Caldilineaceae bacterium]|nr:hypothetical protein [Caldilineaceae bacterium]
MNVLQALNGLVKPVESGLTTQEWRDRALQTEAKLLRVASQSVALQAENARLRHNWRRQRPTDSQIIHRASGDCLLMFGLFLSGFETTRARCLDELGISKRRWNWARALAQLAGVHDGTDFYSHLAMAEVITRLREGAATAEEQPVLLRGYMPKNGGPTRTAGR